MRLVNSPGKLRHTYEEQIGTVVFQIIFLFSCLEIDNSIGKLVVKMAEE